MHSLRLPRPPWVTATADRRNRASCGAQPASRNPAGRSGRSPGPRSRRSPPRPASPGGSPGRPPADAGSPRSAPCHRGGSGCRRRSRGACARDWCHLPWEGPLLPALQIDGRLDVENLRVARRAGPRNLQVFGAEHELAHAQQRRGDIGHPPRPRAAQAHQGEKLVQAGSEARQCVADPGGILSSARRTQERSELHDRPAVPVVQHQGIGTVEAGGDEQVRAEDADHLVEALAADERTEVALVERLAGLQPAGVHRAAGLAQHPHGASGEDPLEDRGEGEAVGTNEVFAVREAQVVDGVTPVGETPGQREGRQEVPLLVLHYERDRRHARTSSIRRTAGPDSSAARNRCRMASTPRR